MPVVAVAGPGALDLGPLAAPELPEAALLLAAAFRDNPLNVAVIRSADPERRLRSNAHGMRSLLPVAQAGGFALGARAEGTLLAVLVCAPPFGYPLPAPALPSRLRCVAGQGWRVARRWRRVFEALAALHPSEPHWYLATLGVAPAWQRRGVGRRLLGHWLQGPDRDGCPAYLETDRRENLAFYAGSGFELEGADEVLGTRIWRMRRPPRS